MRVIDADTGEEELVVGLVLVGSKLVYSEGLKRLAEETLADYIIGPDGEALRADREPEKYMENLCRSIRHGYLYWTEPYEDDDALYDMNTGIFVGDEENPPLPNAE